MHIKCAFFYRVLQSRHVLSLHVGFANWFDLEGKKTIPLNYQRYSKSHRTAFWQSQSLNGFHVIAGFTLNIRLRIVFTREKRNNSGYFKRSRNKTFYQTFCLYYYFMKMTN